ncbi:MAG: hypothetical protein O3B72_06480 [Proteobacteria bacterium]|nr:hypothetical protein [Pseudomonadota bacterium]
MSFISLDFLVFAPLILLLYQVVPGHLRVLLLLAASYLFYAWWDFYYIALILLSSTVAYVSGRQ